MEIEPVHVRVEHVSRANSAECLVYKTVYKE